MEAFNLTLANEDCSLYTYDIRKLKSAACVHKVWHQQPCTARLPAAAPHSLAVALPVHTIASRAAAACGCACMCTTALCPGPLNTC